MTKILIIEDEKKVRKIYTALLKNEGFEVIEAGDAMNAAIELNKEQIDIVLLDIRLPEVNGGSFYDMMKRWHKDIRVIVASVYPVDEQKKIIPGASDYYDKSQGVDVLLEKIRKITGSEKQET